MNYNDMTVEELLLLNSIDVSKFKKDISFYKLYELRHELDLYSTYRLQNFLVIGKHKISFDYSNREILIDKYSNYLKENGCNLTYINEKFDSIKAKRKELKGISFEILDADRIADVYDEDWCYFSGGLSGSCMRGKGNRYHTITSRLSDKDDMKIAVIRNSDGILQARSLIWLNHYYDKIYANDNAYNALLERKLIEEGYEYAGNGDEINIGLEKSLYDYDVPYMDNVCYYNDSELILTTQHSEYEFQEVSGEVWGSRCDNCGDTDNRDNMYILHNGDCICDGCYSNGVIAYAEDEGDYYYTDDLVYLEDKMHYVTDSGWAYRYCTDRDCYYSEDYDLYFAEDTEEYYSDDVCLYYAEDTYEYYYNSNNLYFTVDTELYYRYCDDLYYKDGCWYEDEIEDEDEEEKQKELL